MLGRELQSVDYSQHFIEISPRRHRIDHNELNQLVGPDDEHIAYCLIVCRCALSWIARCGRRQHSVSFRHIEIAVGSASEVLEM